MTHTLKLFSSVRIAGIRTAALGKTSTRLSAARFASLAQSHSAPSNATTSIDMHYVKPSTSGGLPTMMQLYSNDPTYLDKKQVELQDVRGSEAQFSLEANGFEYLKFRPASDIDFTDDQQVQTKYLKEVETFLKKKLGAKTVQAFNHIVRNQIYDPALTVKDFVGYRGPALRPHIDATTKFAPFILYHDPALQASIASSDPPVHWQILNAWRPLAPIRRDPLAIVDAKSMKYEDLLVVPNPESGPGVESYFTRAPRPAEDRAVEEGTEGRGKETGKGHRWCYVSEQQPDELVVFRQYDSEGALAVPHTAVQTSGVDAGEVARESVEVRLFVVY